MTTQLPPMPAHIPPKDNCPRDDLHTRLNNPAYYDLVDLLDGLYHHFNIDDYLDQIGIIDDRITNIRDRLLSWQSKYNIHLMGKQPMVELNEIIDLIDHDID